MDETANRDNEHLLIDCEPLRKILARVGDKWTIVVLTVLGDKRMRFKGLHRAIGGISQRVLTTSLRNLERDGLMVRTVYPTVPPRVDYQLSDRGRSLRDTLKPVGVWASAHHEAIEDSQRRFDQKMRSLNTDEKVSD
jgi:DNA-binding HxlR family transcriptional regulator